MNKTDRFRNLSVLPKDPFMRTLKFLLPYSRRYLVPLTLTVVSMSLLVGRAIVGALDHPGI